MTTNNGLSEAGRPADTLRRIVLAAGLGALSVGVVVGLGWLYAAHHASANCCPATSLSTRPSSGSLSVVMVGQSMAPTLHDSQKVAVDNQAYLSSRPKRGDIVVFVAPRTNRLDIRRVIGLPGDRLLIVGGTVYINGQALKEAYLQGAWTFDNTWPGDGSSMLVPVAQYFVLGDNRNHSTDSRFFGFVDARLIIGRVLALNGSAVPPSGS